MSVSKSIWIYLSCHNSLFDIHLEYTSKCGLLTLYSFAPCAKNGYKSLYIACLIRIEIKKNIFNLLICDYFHVDLKYNFGCKFELSWINLKQTLCAVAYSGGGEVKGVS